MNVDRDFLIGEKDSDISFSAIHTTHNVKGNKVSEKVESMSRQEKVCRATKEEFGYAKVDFTHEFIDEAGGFEYSMECETEDGEMEIREISLCPTAIY